MTESEELVDVTGLSNGNMTKFANPSISFYDLNPDYGSLAGNPFEEDDSTQDRYTSTYLTPAPYKYICSFVTFAHSTTA